MEAVVAGIAAAGVLLGAVLSFLATWLTARSTLKMEHQQTLQNDRRERRNFQRQNLVEIQQALMNWARVTGEIFRLQRNSLQEFGRPALVTDELKTRCAEAAIDLTHLAQRVVNKDARESVLRATEVDPLLFNPQNLQDISASQAVMIPKMDEAGGAVGEALRAYLADN